jgi:hypothetical protein
MSKRQPARRPLGPAKIGVKRDVGRTARNTCEYLSRVGGECEPALTYGNLNSAPLYLLHTKACLLHNTFAM